MFKEVEVNRTLPLIGALFLFWVILSIVASLVIIDAYDWQVTGLRLLAGGIIGALIVVAIYLHILREEAEEDRREKQQQTLRQKFKNNFRKKLRKRKKK